jgi:methionyl-tRNA formyltransferase
VAVKALELGLDVIQPERLHDPEPLARIAAAEPEAVCVCAFGVLIREPLLSAYEMINVHPSLLPRWRGAAPVERAIMAGDAETGASIMRVTEGLDSGAVCMQAPEPIAPDDDYGTLAARLWEGDTEPGWVRENAGHLVLGAAGGGLELTEIRPPGARPMAAADWLRGRPDPRLTEFPVA